MLRLVMPIFVALGLAMIFTLMIGQVLYTIYFSQLEILIFMGYMYHELKNK